MPALSPARSHGTVLPKRPGAVHPVEPPQRPIRRSTFEQSHPGVYTTTGTINGERVRILLDDAAAVNFVSSTFAQQHNIPRNLACNQYCQLADGSQYPLDETVDPLSVQISTYSDSIRCAVTPLAKYDLILGKQWHAETRVVKNPRTNGVSIHTTTFLAKGSSTPSSSHPACQIISKNKWQNFSVAKNRSML